MLFQHFNYILVYLKYKAISTFLTVKHIFDVAYEFLFRLFSISLKKRRVGIMAFFLGLFFVVNLKMIHVFFIKHYPLYKKYGFFQKMEPKRASIVDINGELLAIDIESFDVYIDKSKIIDLDVLLRIIFKHIPDANKRKNLIFDGLKNKSKNMVLVGKSVLQGTLDKCLEDGAVGLYTERAYRRIYPHGNLVSHVVGHTSIDGVGMSGIEKYFNEYLSDPENAVLQISIDLRVQSVVRSALEKGMLSYNSNGAAGVVMNIKTGELVSAVSLPDFDPNRYMDSAENARFNRFSLGVYEFGSVLKIFLAALASESGISKSKKYHIGESLDIGGNVIKDYSVSSKQEMTIRDIIVKSSNIGCAKVTMEIGHIKQINLFKKLGLLDKMSYELTEKGSPFYPKYWRDYQAASISYGHGIAISAMHFVSAAASIIGDGILIKPTFIANKEELVVHQNSLISNASVKFVREIMKLVVVEGTGKRGKVPLYDMGGKTGTAIQIGKDKKYDRKKMVISFLGALPIDDPEYVFFIFLDEPAHGKASRGTTGGSVMGPIMSEIVSQVGPILNIKTKTTKEENQNN